MSLFDAAAICLETVDIDDKLRLSLHYAGLFHQKPDLSGASRKIKALTPQTEKPKLVSPGAVPKRGFATKKSRFALVHALAHIEYNAINLAWDAIYRFRDMPDTYYSDWLKVAEEETIHFNLLRKHLVNMSGDYGDLDAHDGLWTMAEKTAHDVLHRMAIVPRVLEARGLDVTPAMIEKFNGIGEVDIANSLATIYRDEIGHVYIGKKWFQYICEKRGLDWEKTFIELIRQFQLTDFRSGLNKQARREAGFSEWELQMLENEFVKNSRFNI